jgi:tetratricopeptide (TPR) repeat protein
MAAGNERTFGAGALALLLSLSFAQGPAQLQPEESVAPSYAISSLGLSPSESVALQHAIDIRDYITAEKLLLAEINREGHSKRGAKLLAYAGSVYFLNQDYLNAAIAWKRSEAIEPLDPRLQFSLAMAYIRISRPEWARSVLQSLAAADPKVALYPYWLGRLNYDADQYNAAISEFMHAIDLDPRMARAYDNLGLCYYRENKNDLAMENYRKAIELDRDTAKPSPWPYLNLAVTLQFLARFEEAESNLQTAILLDPNFAQAHFQLGLVLEQQDHLDAAIDELRKAANLDATYPEPHMAMARIYRRLGQEAKARDEVQTYLRLHPHSAPQIDR